MVRHQDKVRFCVIGTGRAGMVHARALRRRHKAAELVAVADANEEQVKNAAEELCIDEYYVDWRDALDRNDIDAVCIATPTFTHAEIAVAAAAAGKHVLCEKPMALTLSDCDRMIKAATAAGVKLQIGFMRRFDPAFRAAKSAIDSGEIGDPLLVKSLTRGPGLPPAWCRSLETSNGLLAEVNSHDFDSLRWFMGAEFGRIYAAAGAIKCPDIKNEFPDFYDNVIVAITFQDGRLGIIDGSCPADYGYDARMEVLGTKGTLLVGQVEEENVTICTRRGGVVRPISTSWRSKFREAYEAEEEHFIECILTGGESAVTGIDGRRAVEAVLAGNRSIEEGKPVDLPL